jgi:hypothetical protein
MKITVDIESALIEKATRLTGVTDRSSLVKLGLLALISAESAKALDRLGGTEPQLAMITRRRTKCAS